MTYDEHKKELNRVLGTGLVAGFLIASMLWIVVIAG